MVTPLAKGLVTGMVEKNDRNDLNYTNEKSASRPEISVCVVLGTAFGHQRFFGEVSNHQYTPTEPRDKIGAIVLLRKRSVR